MVPSKIELKFRSKGTKFILYQNHSNQKMIFKIIIMILILNHDLTFKIKIMPISE